jgi:arsenate reductase-like glutaredoxin family protein
MKCSKCDIDYSERVYKVHISRCSVEKKTAEVKPKEEIKIDWRDLGEKAGLEEEELNKFMKKSTKNRQIQLDKLKGE